MHIDPWKVVATTRPRKFLRVDTCQLANGDQIEKIMLEFDTWATVLALTPQQEVILARPAGYYEQYVWLNGYWTWRNDRYEWMAGHWELPPNGTSVWSAPRWEQEGNSYRFYEGYWH